MCLKVINCPFCSYYSALFRLRKNNFLIVSDMSGGLILSKNLGAPLLNPDYGGLRSYKPRWGLRAKNTAM